VLGRATTLGIGPHSSLTIQNKAESKYKHVLAEISRSSLCCHVRRLPLRAARCCLSNETRAAISNPQNSAPLGAPPTIPNLRPGPCGSVGIRPRTDTQTVVRESRTTVCVSVRGRMPTRDHTSRSVTYTFRVVYDSREM